jgi:TIR domain
MSYVRSDDNNTQGYLTNFRAQLTAEVQIQSGANDFEIFQDKYAIDPGNEWKKKIDSHIDSASFMIAIISPSFLKSEACRYEVNRFLKNHKNPPDGKIIFPIYYIKSEVFATLLNPTVTRWRESFSVISTMIGEIYASSSLRIRPSEHEYLGWQSKSAHIFRKTCRILPL